MKEKKARTPGVEACTVVAYCANAFLYLPSLLTGRNVRVTTALAAPAADSRFGSLLSRPQIVSHVRHRGPSTFLMHAYGWWSTCGGFCAACPRVMHMFCLAGSGLQRREQQRVDEALAGRPATAVAARVVWAERAAAVHH